MPVSFRILPKHGLVYVRYEGHQRMEESLRIFSEYARHPDRRPGQKQLVDLSRLTGFENDFPKLFELQAKKAEVFMDPGVQTLLVYYAPTKLAFDLALLAERSWRPFSFVVSLVQETEADALSLLGLRERSLDQLLQSVS